MLRIDRVFKRLFSIRVEVIANAPVERVFGCVADIARHGEWLIWGSVEKASEGPVGVGSTFTYTPPTGLGRARLKVTEFVPQERAAWEWEQMGFRLRRSFELQPVDGGTRVAYEEEWLHLGLLNTLALVVWIPLIPLWIVLQSAALGFVAVVSLIACMVVTVPAYALLVRWHRRRCLRRIESRVTGR